MQSHDKVAIVTGGGRRLGREIAVSLSELGFAVVINYNRSGKEARSTVNLIKKKGSHAVAIKADISKRRQVHQLISRTVKIFGRIDLLVNNASIFHQGELASTTEARWDASIDTNLKGTFLCSQAVAPIMLKQKGGNIINIASVGGLIGWTKYYPYSVSKAGVIMLTKLLARTLAPDISVNAIAPGFIEMKNSDLISRKKMPVKKIPLKRYGTVKDITDTVIFLADKAKYITGQVIAVDGGRSVEYMSAKPR